ncbi:MAG TPA: glycerophosphodiester phosphodiesterase [Gaiellaceae bacterium]|nr:glycerophosphodiester phosphodiesterase [Gaiellaceae bacterium]
MNLLRGEGRALRVGHRGAAALAPANTIQAVEAAIAHGVDLVELDVFGGPDRTLVLGHSRKELGEEPVTLEDVFAFLAETAPDVGLLADLKGAGWEQELVDALRRHDLVERAVASTSNVEVLQALRRLEPRLGRSRTYPRGRLYPGTRRASIPVRGPVLTALRLVLPFRIAALIADVGASAVTLKHEVVSSRVVDRCHELGVAVLVWTVNDRELFRRLDALGVDGVISDDPRIFRLQQHAEKQVPPERPRADGTTS